jgi:molybdopterin molybdotransferase
MNPPLPLDDAQARLLALASPLGAEPVPTERCIGRYLAADVAARRTQPAADLSAMDGYAVAGAGPGAWSARAPPGGRSPDASGPARPCGSAPAR